MTTRDIATRVRERREYLHRRSGGYTQADVADRLEITASGYSRWETGINAISALDLIRLGEILNCSPAYFLSLDDGDTIPADALASSQDIAALGERVIGEIREMTIEFSRRIGRLELALQDARTTRDLPG